MRKAKATLRIVVNDTLRICKAAEAASPPREKNYPYFSTWGTGTVGAPATLLQGVGEGGHGRYE